MDDDNDRLWKQKPSIGPCITYCIDMEGCDILDYLTQPQSDDTRSASVATDIKHRQDIEDVERTVRHMIQAFNAHDWDLLSTYLTPSIVCHSQYNPSRLFSKQEYLARMRDACAMNPDRRTELPGQMVTTVEWSDGQEILTVFGNVRQVGNSSQGDVVRDGFHIMRFVRVDREWLCQDMQGMSGCHYFAVPI